MEKIRLSDAEWKIMQVLWADAPRTYKQIEDALREETGWSKHTILSFLKRMCEKGAIRAEQTKPDRHSAKHRALPKRYLTAIGGLCSPA